VPERQRCESRGGVGGYRVFGALGTAAEGEGEGEHPVRSGIAGAVRDQVVPRGVVQQRLAQFGADLRGVDPVHGGSSGHGDVD
jgi:hypothetical protein